MRFFGDRMIAFLKTIAIGAFWIVSILLLAALLVGLAWWANIPLFTSAVALCVIAALVVIFLAGRRVMIWYNKRRYVRHVLENDPSLVEAEEEAYTSSMSDAWNQGARRQGRLSEKNMPWAFMLGLDDRADIVRALLGNDTEENSQALLQWNSLPELVLLRPHDKYLQSVSLLEHHQTEWEDLLIDLLRARKQHNLGALIVTVTADLLNRHAHDIQNYARILRARIHEISTTAAAHIPLYVLITHSERLPGMCDIIASLPEELRTRSWGSTFPLWTSYTANFDEESAPPNTFAEYAHITITHAVATLREHILSCAAKKNMRPQRDVYAAPGAVEALEKGLAIFLNCLFFAKATGATARLRAVYLTCTQTETYAATATAMQSDPFAHLTKTVPTTSAASAPNIAQQNRAEQESTHGTGGMPHILFTPPTATSPMTDADIATLANEQGNSDTHAHSTTDENTLPLPNMTHGKHSALPFTPYAHTPKQQWNMAFVEEIFLQRLPADRFLQQPIKHGIRFEQLALPCTSAWYLLLFSFCGIIAANTIYTSHTMRELKQLEVVAEQSTLAPGYAELLQQSSRLTHLDSAIRRWWFPLFGINQIQTARKTTATHFINSMEQKLIPLILRTFMDINDGYVLRSLATETQQNSASDYALASHTARCLLWMQDAVGARFTGEKFINPLPPAPPISPIASVNTPVTAATADPSPATTLAALSASGMPRGLTPLAEEGPPIDALWSLNFGQFFLLYVKVADETRLQTLQKQLAEAVHTLFDNNERNMLAYLEHQVNTKLARKAVPLSDFWPNVPAGTEGFTQVLPMYTKAGYSLLEEQVQRLLGDDVGTLREQAFWKDYEQRYATAWKEFILQTDTAWQDVTQVSTLYTTAMVKRFEDIPTMRLLKRAAEELTPLHNSVVAPAWVEKLQLMQALVDVVRLSRNTKPNSFMAMPSTLMSIFETPDASFDALLETQDMSMVLDAINDLRNYQQALKDLQGTLTSEAGTYELARAEYEGNAKESNFAVGHNNIQTCLGRIGINIEKKNSALLSPHSQLAQAAKPDADNPIAFLMQGPLRFLAHTLTCASALTVQKYWEATVLAPAIILPQEKFAQALAGEQGLLQAFVTNVAAPFLNRQVGSYTTKTWLDTSFPFTEDFLSFVQQGNVVGMNLPQDSYEISMFSQTSNVNADAKERLQYFELSTTGPAGTDAVTGAPTTGAITLRNSNYPARKTFTYVPKTPHVVRLTLSFPSTTLSYVYPDMPAFLKDFAYGERIFTPEDFPAQTETLKSLGIQQITIRILPENAAAIVAAQENTLPALPERITHVW